MKIHNQRFLKDLKGDFNKTFPYLKLEFFKYPHEVGTASEENEKLDPRLQVGTVRKNSATGEVQLDGKMRVADFEKKMRTEFGLNVQVYRKEHGKWLQSSVTDVWSLEDQNNRSKVMGDIDDLLAERNF